MAFSERGVLALLGTNYQFLVIFLTKIQFTLANKSRSYLVIILVSAENVVLHKYVVAKGSSILTAFLDTLDTQKPV